VADATRGERHQAAPTRETTEKKPVPQDVSLLLEPILEKHGIPGMVAAAITSDRTVALGAAGVRRRGSPPQVTIDDRFHIGSCTKAMTATLCAILVEEGKLSWGTTVGQSFPDLTGTMRTEFRGVTLEQLLTHRGGIPKRPHEKLWKQLREHRGAPIEARQMLLRGVLRQEPAAKPAAQYVYSNAGYAIAGHMAEKAAGKPWETLLREKVLQPLGMDCVGFGAPGKRGTVDQPYGHTASGDPVEPGPHADNPPAIGPAGTVHCPIESWAKFVATHLRGAQQKQALVDADAFAKLHVPAKGDPPKYAMGWMVVKRDWAQGSALTHTGSNTMWFAVTWVAPARDFAVLVACNQGGSKAAKACDEVAWTLIERLLLQKAKNH